MQRPNNRGDPCHVVSSTSSSSSTVLVQPSFEGPRPVHHRGWQRVLSNEVKRAGEVRVQRRRSISGLAWQPDDGRCEAETAMFVPCTSVISFGCELLHTVLRTPCWRQSFRLCACCSKGASSGSARRVVQAVEQATLLPANRRCRGRTTASVTFRSTLSACEQHRLLVRPDTKGFVHKVNLAGATVLQSISPSHL